MNQSCPTLLLTHTNVSSAISEAAVIWIIAQKPLCFLADCEVPADTVVGKLLSAGQDRFSNLFRCLEIQVEGFSDLKQIRCIIPMGSNES